jgi:Tol biopolymer transport system component
MISLPRGSPDGTKIAFSSNPLNDVREEIIVLNADRSNRVNLTCGSAATDTWPNWSPDGCGLRSPRSAQATLRRS